MNKIGLWYQIYFVAIASVLFVGSFAKAVEREQVTALEVELARYELPWRFEYDGEPLRFFDTRRATFVESPAALVGADTSAKLGRPGRNKERMPTCSLGPITCTNCMDKRIIRRLVRRKLSRIKNCYEQELVVHNDLEGTVVVDFMVNTNGTVASARGKGMGNSTVESCVASAIKSIKFPFTPSMFSVSYPFTFRAP